MCDVKLQRLAFEFTTPPLKVMHLIPKIYKVSFRISLSRNRLFLYVSGLLFVAILTAIAVSTLLYLRKQTEAQVSATSQSIVRSLGLIFEGRISAYDSTLFAASKSVGQMMAQNASKKEIDDYLVLIQKQLPFNSALRATNAAGDVVYGEGTRFPAPSIADRDYFTKLRDTPDSGLEVISPLVGKVDNQWVWPFARRINAPDGSFAGVVLTRMNISDIGEIFQQVNMTDRGVFVLRDKNFGLIAHHKRDGNALPTGGDTTMSDAFIDAVAANNDEGRYSVTADKSTEGVNRTYSYRRSPVYQFMTLVGQDRNATLSGWYLQVKVTVGLLLILALAVWITVRVLDRYLLHKERENAQLHQLLSEQKAMLDNDLVGIVKLRDWKFIWVNKAFTRICGYDANEVMGKDARIIFPDDETFASVGQSAYEDLLHGEHREQRQLVHKSGALFWVDLTGGALSEDDRDSLWIMADITELKKIEGHVRQLALYDSLTDLPNRRLLNERFAHTILLNKRHSQHGALLFIDLDKFKAVNDTYGHTVGDLLLIEVGRRLTSAVRESDTVARVGGDEFVVVLSGLDGVLSDVTEQTSVTAEKIRELLARPYILECQTEGQSSSTIELLCTASIGVVIYPRTDGSNDDYLKLADSAMYLAKNGGANAVQFYVPE